MLCHKLGLGSGLMTVEMKEKDKDKEWVSVKDSGAYVERTRRRCESRFEQWDQEDLRLAKMGEIDDFRAAAQPNLTMCYSSCINSSNSNCFHADDDPRCASCLPWWYTSSQPPILNLNITVWNQRNAQWSTTWSILQSLHPCRLCTSLIPHSCQPSMFTLSQLSYRKGASYYRACQQPSFTSHLYTGTKWEWSLSNKCSGD